MPPPYAGHIEARIVGTLHGSQCINVLHFATHTQIFDGDPTDLLLQLAEALLACAVDTLLPGVTSDYTLLRVEAKAISPQISDPVTSEAPANSVGALGPTSVSFAASLLNVRTGVGGRRGRGKMFLPPPGEPQTLNSEIDAPTLALLAAFAACVAGKFIAPGNTTAFIYGILSQTDIAGGATHDNSFREAKTISANKIVAQMGSRKKGVGA